MSDSDKFTPGPWEYQWDEYGGYDCMSSAFTIKSGDQTICDIDLICYGEARMQHPRGPLPLAEANARLIAASPDLYEALKAITNHMAAILGGPVFKNAGITFLDGIENIPTIKAARAALAKVSQK